MLSYSKFHKHNIPSVQFDIRDEQLSESEHLNVEHYLDFVGSPHETPEKQGYVRYIGNIYKHKEKPGYFHFGGREQPTHHAEIDDAMEHDLKTRSAHENQLDEAHTKLATHYDDHQPMTGDEKDAVVSYTSAHSTLNSRILNNKLVDLDIPKMKHMDSALNRSTTPHSLTVYTGTDADHAHLLRKNTLVHHPSYVSTSLSLRKATAFAASRGGDVIAIHIPAGHAGRYVGGVSQIQSEREFLLPRGLTFKLDRAKRQVVSKEKEGDIIIHHATIAGDE